MFLSRTILFTLLSAAITSTAAAQSPAQLSKGRKSIEFTLPNAGGGTIGLWKFTTDNRNVGLNLGFQYGRGSTVDDRQSHSWSVSAAPTVKSYFDTRRQVAPYKRFGLSADYSRTSFESPLGTEPTPFGFSVGAKAGLGADWFPNDQISIGGYAGLGVSKSWSGHGNHSDATSWSIGTFSSALSVNIYF
jgi:hypothetical protein